MICTPTGFTARIRVGEDVEKNDFMEHLTSYAQQEADALALQAMLEQTLPETQTSEPTVAATETVPEPTSQSNGETFSPAIWSAISIFASLSALFLLNKKFFEKM